MEMPGRTYKATGSAAYRYGFNGKENDNEVKGEGNQQDYGFRIYDPRVARFLSVDPLAYMYPSSTPFNAMANNPISLIDADGREPRWGQLASVASIQSEFLKAKGWRPNSTIGSQLAALSGHFSADRVYERDEHGWLVDAINSNDVKRYVYTTSRGWIDMNHFLQFANFSRQKGEFVARVMIIASEEVQAVTAPSSSYSYEDLPSDQAGIDFWHNYGKQLTRGDFSLYEAVGKFLNDLGAVIPNEAPNYELIPHVVKPEFTPRNKSVKGLTGDVLRKAHEESASRRPKDESERIEEAHSEIEP